MIFLLFPLPYIAAVRENRGFNPAALLVVWMSSTAAAYYFEWTPLVYVALVLTTVVVVVGLLVVLAFIYMLVRGAWDIYQNGLFGV